MDEVLSYISWQTSGEGGGKLRKVGMDLFWHSAARGVFNFDGSQGPWSQSPAPAACDALASPRIRALRCQNSNQTVLALSDFFMARLRPEMVPPGRRSEAPGLRKFIQHVFAGKFMAVIQEVERELTVCAGIFSGPPQPGPERLRSKCAKWLGGCRQRHRERVSNGAPWKQFDPKELGSFYHPQTGWRAGNSWRVRVCAATRPI